MEQDMRSIRSPALLGFLSVGAIILSGCTGGGDDKDVPLDSAAPAQFDESTGGIQGSVTDTEFQPVAAAAVAIVGLGLETLTDVQGGFSFSNVEPGDFQIEAAHLGYLNDRKPVQVEAGDVTEVELVLSAVTIPHAFHETLTQRGLFGCGTSWNPGIPPEPGPGIRDVPGGGSSGLPNRIGGIAGCGVLSGPGFEDLPTAQFDQFSLEWQFNHTTSDWMGAVFEMEWTTNQLTGRGLSMVWEINNCFNRPEFEFADGEGPSPLRGETNRTQIEGILANTTVHSDLCDDAVSECNEDQCTILSRVFAEQETTNSETGDIGVSFQQQYNAYFSYFILEPQPPEWTALEEG